MAVWELLKPALAVNNGPWNITIYLFILMLAISYHRYTRGERIKKCGVQEPKGQQISFLL
jgi:hypothetical protein